MAKICTGDQNLGKERKDVEANLNHLKVFLLLLWWATLPQPLTPPVFDPPPTLLLLPEAQDSPWPSALAQTREVREPVADKGGRRAAAVVPRRKEAGSGGGSRGGACCLGHDGFDRLGLGWVTDNCRNR